MYTKVQLLELMQREELTFCKLDVMKIHSRALSCSVWMQTRLLQWQKEEASKTQPDSSYFREQIREGFLLDC